MHEPKIALAVVVENGGFGVTTATPIAEIVPILLTLVHLRFLLRLLGLQLQRHLQYTRLLNKLLFRFGLRMMGCSLEQMKAGKLQ